MDKEPYYKKFFKYISTWEAVFESLMLLSMFIVMDMMKSYGIPPLQSWLAVMCIYLTTAITFSKYN